MSYDFDEAEGFLHAINKACASMTLNDTVRRLESDPEAVMLLKKAISEQIGQDTFVNLTNSSKQAMTAIALYAGDGIVTKIIPRSALAMSTDVIYHLPAVTTLEVSSEQNDFVVKTYPYVDPSNVTQSQVDEFGEVIALAGMKFNNGDGMPKNVHRLPDANGTFIGIDSNMYGYGEEGSLITDELRQAWMDYIYELYPIYENRVIPRQSDDTNFDAISLHDPSVADNVFDIEMFKEEGSTSGDTLEFPEESSWEP